MWHPHVQTCVSVKDTGRRVRVWQRRLIQVHLPALRWGLNLRRRPPILPRPFQATKTQPCFSDSSLLSCNLSKPNTMSTYCLGLVLHHCDSERFYLNIVCCLMCMLSVAGDRVEHVRPCNQSDPSGYIGYSVLNNLMASYCLTQAATDRCTLSLLISTHLQYTVNSAIITPSDEVAFRWGSDVSVPGTFIIILPFTDLVYCERLPRRMEEVAKVGVLTRRVATL